MKMNLRKLVMLMSLCLCSLPSTSCQFQPDDEPGQLQWTSNIDSDDPIWSSEADVFDDFDRADGDRLGSTRVGGYAWTSEEVAPPRILGHALAPRGSERALSAASLDRLALDDFLLSLWVEVENSDARWSLQYRASDGSGYRIEGTRDSLSLFRGEERLAQVEIELPVGEPSRLQLVVDGSVHHVMVAGQSVLEVEDAGGVLAGGIVLEGSEGIHFDDLWIRAITADDGSTEGTGGANSGGEGGARGRREASENDGGIPPDDRDELAIAHSPVPIAMSDSGGIEEDEGDGGVGDGGDPIRGAAAPPIDLTVPTTLYKQVRFLFDGPAPEQQGADLDVLVPARISLVHGWVRDSSGLPLADVEVWALGYPEFGATVTRADGSYDLVVTGGAAHSIVLSHPSYLSVQRKVVAEAGSSHRADDAVMLAVDAESSPILFVDPIEIHQTSTPNDGAPERMTTVMFRRGTLATMVFDDGSTEYLPEMTVRLTEYTVGDEGPERMPGPLPPGTAYNYAVEISADEAEATGAASVELSTPAVLYVDNFLEWPVGAVVPSGAFDRLDGRWKAEPDGRVIEIVGVDSKWRAEIDATGDGIEATEQELAELGLTEDERAELASIYMVGARLWRTPVDHFTPFDLNPAAGGNGQPADDGFGPDEDGEIDGCETPGSIIGIDNQDLGESMPIAGTPFSLEYRSSRTRGAPNRGLRMQVTGDEIPGNLSGAFAVAMVAGRLTVSYSPPVPNAYVDLQWDGLDGHGRPVQGPQPIDLCVGWEFPFRRAVVSSVPGGGGGGPPSGARAFGRYPAGAYITDFPGRTGAVYLKCYGNGKSVAAAAIDSITNADKYRLGGLDAQSISDGLGGWTLDVHHTLARSTSTIYLGDGDERELADEAQWVVSRFAGNRETQAGLLEGEARGAFFDQPSAVAADRSGNIYIATPGLVRRIDAAGGAVIVAGTTTDPPSGVYSVGNHTVTGFAGDGGPATDAWLSNSIPSLAVDALGGIYLADASNYRVRYIDPSGVIDTVAGSGVNDGGQVYEGMTQTGGDPLQVSLVGLQDLTLTPDEEGLLIAQGFAGGGMIRMLTLEDELLHIAGDPAPDFIDLNALRPWIDCPAGTCGGGLAEIRSSFPSDTIPGLDGYLEDHEYRAEWADFDVIRGVTTHGDSIFVGEGDRIRRIDGMRGGNIFAFRKRYIVTPPLQCGSGSCNYPTETDIPAGTLIQDLVADDNGVLYTTSDQALFLARDDLDTPQELIIGGPLADTWMEGDDDLMLASRLQMSSYTDLVRAPDGAIYIADSNRNLVYRVAKAVPPMYQSSWVTSEDGTERFLFDDEGRHLETRDAKTHQLVWSFQYDEDGLLSSVLDRFGDTTTIHRDGSGAATSIESHDGQLTTFSQDPNGYLATITDPSGAPKTFTYSSTGLMQSMSDFDSWSTFQYDERGRLTNDDATILYEDAFEGTIPQVLERTQSTATFVEVTHTSGNNIVTLYQRERTGASSIDRTVVWPDGTQNTGYSSPEADSVTYPDGTTVTTRYGIDPRLGVNTRVPTSLEVAIAGGPTDLTTFDRSYEPHCTLFFGDCDPFADPELQADEIVDSLTRGANTWTETYRRAHLEGGSPVLATSTLTTPLGREVVTTLNGEGLVGGIALAGIAPLSYGYDPRGRLESVTRTDGVSIRSTSITYDPEGFVSSTTDILGRTTSYLYDDVGRVTQQTFPDGRFVLFDYDDDGNIVSVTPPSRPAHVFTHDSVDRMRSYEPPVVPAVPAPQTIYAYNGDHQPEVVTLPDGQSLQLLYDAISGKLDHITTPTGNYDYSYDPASGRLESVTDPDGGSLTYTYSGFLTTSEVLTGSTAGEVSWTYDSKLRIDSESINGGLTVAIAYDADGAPSTVGDLSLTTDPLNGNLVGTTLGGLTSTYAANGFGEPSQSTYEHSGSTIYDLELLRDEVGRVLTKTETREGVVTLRCYGYDLAGRLTTVHDGADSLGCTGNVIEQYGYDGNGNRNQVANQGLVLKPGVISIDDQDRLLQYGDLVFTYSENGNVETRTEGGLVTTFEYDLAGNLQHVDLEGTPIDYVYDARDRRVGKEVGGFQVQGFLYGDQLNPIAELDGAGVVVSRFVYGTRPNVPDYMVDVTGGGTYRIIADHLGSVVAVVDVTTGVIAQEIAYDAWGRVLSDSNPGFQPFGFAGGIYDPHTGWMLFGARDYRPRVGAWSAKDPLGFGAGDSNLYRYTAGDPVNFVDSTGLVIDSVTSTCGRNPKLCAEAGLVTGFVAGKMAQVRSTLAAVCKTIVRGLRALQGAGQAAAGPVCFASGTSVQTADGHKPIEEIEIGDLVWTRDDETKKEGWKPVTEVFVTPERKIIELTFAGKGDTFETLQLTPEHPLWSLDDQEWEEAGDLDLGERIDAQHGPMWLDSAAMVPETETVYNFEVADSHTYFVGDAGIWVHNSCFQNAAELAKRFGTNAKEFHRSIKPQILKDAADFAKQIGAKNPDIGITSEGNIMLRNQRTGSTITTDLLAEWFMP